MRGGWLTGKNWPTTITVIVIISWLIVLGIYWSTTVSIVNTWYRSQTFTHGFIVLPISAYLIWERCHAFSVNRPKPNAWVIFLLASLGFGWLLGNLTNVLVVQEVATVAMLPIIVWTILGSQNFYVLMFPLLFLFFAAPIGEFLISPLQDFTALFIVKGLQLSGIPVFQEGRSLTVPGTVWLVAPACSGVRYIISMFALGCLFASLIFRSWGRRLLFILASILLPIVGNGIRGYGIVLLGYLSDTKLALSVDHIIYGWVFFLILLFSLCWVGYKWHEVNLDNLFYSSHRSLTTGNPQSIGQTGTQEIALSDIRKMLLVGGGARH